MQDSRHGRASASIVDLKRSQLLFGYNEQDPQLLASVTKVFSIGGLLETLGGGFRLKTRLFSTEAPDGLGVVTGDLFLVGGGDSTLGGSQFNQLNFKGQGTELEALAEIVVGAGVMRVTGGVVGDGSRFVSERGAPALSFERTRAEDPALEAATHLTELLRSRNVVIEAAPSAGKTNTEFANPLGEVLSPTLMSMLTKAGHDSDNMVIETLAKSALLEAGGQPATIGASAANVQDHAKRFGSEIEIVNASGLERANFCAPSAVTDYLSSMARSELISDFTRALPRAGHDGTLRDRMRNTRASDIVSAKTGTLTRAGRPVMDALAGYVFGSEATLAFAIFMDSPATRPAARSSIDRVVDVLARYAD